MTSFQDAKDSFYLQLRDRLAAVNPDRTVVVRGATRPAVLVAENELEPGGGDDPKNAFVLHWGATEVDASEAMPLEGARCEIHFATAGSPELAGMDRGRTLSAMRGELTQMLRPQMALKTSYDGPLPIATLTPVFWSDVMEERSTSDAGTLGCVCVVKVFAWQEAG